MPQAAPHPVPVQRASPDLRTNTPVAPQAQAVESPRPVAATPSLRPQPDPVSQMPPTEYPIRPSANAIPAETRSVSEKTDSATPVIPTRVPQHTESADALSAQHQPRQVEPRTQPVIAQASKPAWSNNIAARPAPKPAHSEAVPEIVAKRPVPRPITAETSAKIATPSTAPDKAPEVRPAAAPQTPKPQTTPEQVVTAVKPVTLETPPPATMPEPVSPRQTVTPTATTATAEWPEPKLAAAVAQVPKSPAAPTGSVPIQRPDARAQALQQAPVANQEKPAPIATRVEPRPAHTEVAQPTNPQAAQTPSKTAGAAQPAIANPAAAQPTTVAPNVSVQSPPADAQPIETPRDAAAPKPAAQTVTAPPANPAAATVEPNRGTSPQPVTAQPAPPPAPAASNAPPAARADAPAPRPEQMLAPARPRDMVTPQPDARRDRVKLGETRTTMTRTADAAQTADPKPALRPADPVNPAPQPTPQPSLVAPAPRDVQTAAPRRAPEDTTMERTAPRPATLIPDPVAEPQMPKLAKPTTPVVSADLVPSSEPAELRLDPVRDAALTPTQVPAKSVMPQQADLSARVMDQIAQHARQLPGGPVEITLSPEELGRVRMQLTTAENGLTLVVTADRPETLDLLRRNIDQLANEYRSLGYGALSFAFQGDGTPRDGHPGGHQPGGAPLTMAEDISPDTAPPPLTAATGMDIRI